MTNTFAALGNRDYRLFWGANFSMYISRWMQMTTLSWFVLERTNSAFNVGLIGFFGMVPFLVLGVFGGFLADNLNKKRLIIITQFLTFFSALIFLVLLIFDSVNYWYAYIAIVIPGIGWALDMPSRRSVIMDIIGPSATTNGVALDSVGMHFSKMIGPAAAGALIAFEGVVGSYLLLTFVMMVGCFFVLMVNQPGSTSEVNLESHTTSESVIGQVLGNLLEGFKYAISNQAIVGVIVITVFMNLLLFPYMQMVTVISREVLSVGPLLMGILMSSDGLGALIGSTYIASRSDTKYQGRFFLYGSLLSLVALLIFAMSKWYLVSLPLLLILGMGTSGFGTMQSTIVLLVSKLELRGRALGIVTLAIGAGPIGALILGAVSESIGPSKGIFINALIGLFLVGASGLLIPAIRGRIEPNSI